MAKRSGTKRPATKTRAVPRKSRKYVYFFGDGKADGNRTMKDLLGGKGSGLAEMTNAGLPVPPGFTISTEVCTIYSREQAKLPAAIEQEIDANLGKLERTAGMRFGSPDNPMLVSVRSGAKFSMPGMMDTILNLGLNDAAVEGLERRTNNGRFAYDSYRRFMQMFGNVVLDIPKDAFEHELEAVKKARGVRLDTELDRDALREVVDGFKRLVERRAGREFPQDPREQLTMARNAVFRSWMNPRAKEYRRIYDIPDHIGTAVNVQLMVFGNTGDRSATGVGFTRNPATGKKEFYGEFLINAQGEDVVAGIRTPQPIRELERRMPKTYRQLRDITTRLEKHYKDVQDFEFTIENEHLYMLQTRSGKRTGYAAIVIATDLVIERLITPREALLLVDPESLTQLLAPGFDPVEWKKIPTVTKGLPASPGAASGQVVFSADHAVEWTREGRQVVLVRRETVSDDIHGMYVSQGILTATGGMTSHAAVVGRQMGKPAVVSAGAIEIDEAAGLFRVAGRTVKEGDHISFDGQTGEVKISRVATKPSEILRVLNGTLEPKKSDIYQRFRRLLSWSDRFRRMEVRANADMPDQAELAYAFGARGIGLCRTEHMFFGEDRVPIVQRMILAHSEAERRAALQELLPLQRADFYGLFKAMHGLPVTIRTLDPPLHEFLPKREELMVDIARLEITGQDPGDLKKKRQLLQRVEQLHEFNPMLGHRGVRLGITYPEITEMQTRAIIEAACQLNREGLKIVPEIMIPLVGDVKELRNQKADRRSGRCRDHEGAGDHGQVPRRHDDRGAARRDDRRPDRPGGRVLLVRHQRSDAAHLRLLARRRRQVPADLPGQEDPREGSVRDRSTARASVQSSERASSSGRKTRPDIKLGVCGEHGGDPASIHFFETVGLDYVSASPYRVPVARLAAAQAAMSVKVGD